MTSHIPLHFALSQADLRPSFLEIRHQLTELRRQGPALLASPGPRQRGSAAAPGGGKVVGGSSASAATFAVDVPGGPVPATDLRSRCGAGGSTLFSPDGTPRRDAAAALLPARANPQASAASGGAPLHEEHGLSGKPPQAAATRSGASEDAQAAELPGVAAAAGRREGSPEHALARRGQPWRHRSRRRAAVPGNARAALLGGGGLAQAQSADAGITSMRPQEALGSGSRWHDGGVGTRSVASLREEELAFAISPWLNGRHCRG